MTPSPILYTHLTVSLFLLFLLLGDDEVVCEGKQVDGGLPDTVLAKQLLLHPQSNQGPFPLQLTTGRHQSKRLKGREPWTRDWRGGGGGGAGV